MPSYPSAITLSTRALTQVADLIRAHRSARKSRWRSLDAGAQALLVLAHLRKRHGVNIQVIADPHGRLIWLSAALPGAVRDLKAARHHGILAALTRAAVAALADKAYRGGGRWWRCRSTADTCPVACARSTPPTPRSAPSANAPTHPEVLEDPDQAPLLPPPRHRDHRRHPGPAARPGAALARLEKALSRNVG